MSILFAGVIAAVAMIFLFLKLDLRKVLGYDVWVDITFTLLLMYALAGTFSGMMAALIGGAILSVFLYAMRLAIGYKRLVRVAYHLEWRSFEP